LSGSRQVRRALPHAVDPQQAERDRLFAESQALQASKLAAIMREPSAEVKAEREAVKQARLKAIVDQREIEALEILEAQAERCAREGDHRSARNFREQKLGVRAQLLKECT
jgi:hypothetical protein